MVGPDYDETGDGWVDSTVIAVQGWESTFYTGLPAEWSDPPALWIGPSSGDDENAPAGRCLFRRWTLIGEGPAALDYAGDNTVVAYINGRRAVRAASDGSSDTSSRSPSPGGSCWRSS